MTDSELFRHTGTDDSTAATITVDTDTRAEHPVEPMLFGKFCEHLGNNIYHGMDAQLLFNPVFGEWHVRASERRPSGGFGSENDSERIRQHVEASGRPLAYPTETDPDALLAAYWDGLAFGWQPVGDIECGPDTGPTGDRAQWLEIGGNEGIRQPARLPLHRTRGYEFRLRGRATDETTLDLAIRPTGGDEALASASVTLSHEWTTTENELALPDDADSNGVYDLVLTTPEPAEIVVERVLLYPDDHLDNADPDVIALLRASELPLLRWPGGNFVSGYDWRDGIGPVDDRPTNPNPAWNGLEYNLFGTDEFMQFCEHVGCEPTICVNAGDGSPEEAAAWVEYCNGDQFTEMGQLRAEHGHPEPYDVTYWEIGNELYGKLQVNWTTPAGNADRYERFREAMCEADPSIEVTACGHETSSNEWNDVLLERCGANVRALSEHVLAGGQVDANTDPDELYHAFMGYSDQLGRRFRDLRERMHDAGVDNPTLDITELQLFAHYEGGAEGTGSNRLVPETMPTPPTISEALYDATIRHELVRLGGFIEMLTHSATVNHGGGLKKEGERVWADPCHHGRAMGMALAGKTPVAVAVSCDTISTEASFGEIDPVETVPAIDAMAVIDEEESELTLVVVNRTSHNTVELTIDTGEFDPAANATVTVLSGETMHAKNTREEPERIAPEESIITFETGTTLDLTPYSMVRLTVPHAE